MALFGISKTFAFLFLVKIKDSKAWLVLSNKMDGCYLLLYVQEIRIQPYFCVKQGDDFFPLFTIDPVWSIRIIPLEDKTALINALILKF